MTGDGLVTVCIPAYRAEAFIDRTLRCARAQSHEAQRVLVAIDRSEDGTEEICREHARADGRVEVHAHREQQGWFGNVNSLLDRVDTEFSFVYFHDDVIDSTYSEQLVGALRRRPDAASAHCDVIVDRPDGESLRRGGPYEGSAVERVLNHLVNPERGALLRSMVRRSSPAGSLRMTLQGAQYEMGLVAAGPAMHVPEPLYRRFDQRVGGLTDSWKRRPFEHYVEGCRYNATIARELMDSLHPSPDERDLLEFGLAVYMSNRLRSLEALHAATGLTPLEDVLGPGRGLQLPAAVDRLPEDLARACRTALRRTERRDARRAAQVAGSGSGAAR